MSSLPVKQEQMFNLEDPGPVKTKEISSLPE
jgi:hypothetical protein